MAGGVAADGVVELDDGVLSGPAGDGAGGAVNSARERRKRFGDEEERGCPAGE